MSYIPLTKTNRNNQSRSNSNSKLKAYKNYQLSLLTNTNRIKHTKKENIINSNIKHIDKLLYPSYSSNDHTLSNVRGLKTKQAFDIINTFTYKKDDTNQQVKNEKPQLNVSLKPARSSSHIKKINYIATKRIHYQSSHSNMNVKSLKKGSLSSNKIIDKRRLQHQLQHDYSTNKTFGSLEDILGKKNTEGCQPTNRIMNENYNPKSNIIPYYINSDSFNQKTRSESYNPKKNKSALSNNIGKITILVESNWGNPNKVGIRGLKLFDSYHKEIDIIRFQVNNPSKDLYNITTRHSNYHTSVINAFNDESWCCPFNAGSPLHIELIFYLEHNLSLIELWNYSGIDLSLGAKDVKIIKDSVVIWSGIIPQGIKLDSNQSYSNIESSLVINIKSNHFKKIIVNRKETSPYSNRIKNGERPLSSNKRYVNKIPFPIPLPNTPNDHSMSLSLSKTIFNNQVLEINDDLPKPIQVLNTDNIVEEEEDELTSLKCNKIKLILLSNYGALKQVGLTGLDIYDDKDKIITPIYIKETKINPILSLNHQLSDRKGVEVLFNMKNESVSEKNMYITHANYLDSKFKSPFIEISFIKNIHISKIALWNYNSIDNVDKGTKELQILFYYNNKLSYKSNHIILKGVGEEGINYSQLIHFPFESTKPFEHLQYFNPPMHFLNEHLCGKYHTSYLPCGSNLKVLLMSSWGDSSLIGLKNIKIYDHLEELVIPKQIYSFPERTEIEGCTEDLLFQYINLKKKGVNRTKGNRLLFLFEKPICLSCIKIKNYFNEPNKGVKDFKILLDDNMIYEGQCTQSLNNSLNNDTIILFKSKELFHKLKIDDTFLQEKLVNKYDIIEKNHTKILRIKNC